MLALKRKLVELFAPQPGSGTLVAAEARAARRDELRAREAALLREIRDLERAAVEIRQRRMVARDALAQAAHEIAEHERAHRPDRFGGRTPIPAELLTARARAEENVAMVEQALEANATALALARSERERIKREDLSTVNLGTDLAAVLEQQTRLQAARSQVQRIDALAAAQEKVIEEAEAVLAGVQSLTRDREDMLAAIAAGVAGEPELSAFDTAAKKQRAAVVNAETAAANARAALAGLARARAQAQAVEQEMESRARDYLRQYLFSEIDRIGADYLRAAREVWTLSQRLAGLKALGGDIFPEDRARIGAVGAEVRLPTFDLKAAEPDASPSISGLLFLDRMVNPRDAEQRRLEEQGVILPN